MIVGLLLSNFITNAQQVVDIDHLSMTVSDLEQAIDFFEENLDATLDQKKIIREAALMDLMGIHVADLTMEVAYLHIGEEEIRLLHFNKEGRKIPLDSRSNDLWFQHMAVTVSDMDTAYANVFENKVKHVSTAPQTLPDYIPEAAGIAAFYFRDTDEHNIELIYFPSGKGDPKWQNASAGDYFLGIDHSAIAISDTDQSLAFYRDLLGLKVVGHSENYGTEQEHLNQVFGARLAITGMRAAQGIGVEFLEYIAPPGGRLYPRDSSPLDHWHWQIAMEVDDLNKMKKKIDQTDHKLISNKIISLPELGYDKAILLRDPDHHAILLYETNNK